MNENENETQNTISFEQTNSTNPEPEVAQVNKGGKKKGNAFLIIPIILIIAIIAAVVYYFGYYTSTQQFYKRLLGAGVEAIAMSDDEEDYKTYKAGIKLDMNFESETEEISSEVEELINELEVAMETQIDKESEQLVVKIESEYDNDELLNLDVYADVKNEETYIYAKDFLDKYLEIELEDEYYTELAEIFETEEENPISEKRAVKVFKTELSKMIKSEYCSTEKETIEVNGKKVNATRRTIKMTYQQFVDEFIEAMSNIKEYEDVKDSREFAQLVEDAKDELQETISGEEDTIIQIDTYTTGILSKVVRVDIVITDKDGESVTLACTQIGDKKYSVDMISEEETLINLMIDMSKEQNAKLEIDVEELGKLVLDIEYSEEYNTKIDEVDEDNCATMEELTQEEQLTLAQNLQKSPIYTLLQQFSDTEDQPDINWTEDNNSTIDDNNVNIDIDTNTNTDTDINTNTSKLNDNQILTYDDETLITFGIPAGYTVNRISDNYQTLEKGNTDITIKSSYSNEAEYYSLLKDGLSYYSEQSYYKNVSLSEAMTMTVGTNTFYYATEKMTYVSGSYERTYTTLYLWKKVSNDYILEIEIVEPSGLTQEELKQLLTIETSNM